MHTRIETRTFAPGAVGALTPQQRIDRIREALTQERAARRTIAHGSLDEDTVSRNIVDLEQLLERAEENETIRVAAKQERRAAEDARPRERTAEAAQELARQLMDTYMQASPGTTDAEAKAALPELLHKHRMRQIGKQEELVAEALSRYRI